MDIEKEKTTKRNSFVFYEGFETSISVLPAKYQLEAYRALVRYGLQGDIASNTNGVVRAVLEAFRPQIDANNARYENGKKGGRKTAVKETETEPKQTKDKPNGNQTQPKQRKGKANVNVNVYDIHIKESNKEIEGDGTPSIVQSFLNKNLGLENRKELFWQELMPSIGQYSEQMIKSFYIYWTEPSANGKRLRLDGEKYFAVRNRLATWASRENK